ncbi:MAG: hypothetical protein ABIC04_07325 [Nanoarchaeota archaeon]
MFCREIKKQYHWIIPGIIFLFLMGCGGGFIPSSVKKGKIVVNKLRFQKKNVLNCPKLNLITDFYLDTLENDVVKSLIIAGSDGACFCSECVRDKKCFSFLKDNVYNVKVVRLQDSPTIQFLTSGLWGDPAVALFDSSGKLIWEYRAKFKHTTAPGIIDFGDDGKQRILMYVSGAGLLFFDPGNGQITNKMAKSPLWDLKTADFDGDGKNDALLLDEENNLQLMSANGDIQNATKLNFDYSTIALCNSSSGMRIFLSSSTKLYMFGPKLELLTKFSVPIEKQFQIVSVAMSNIRQEAEKKNIIISLFKGRGGWHRTILFVHTVDGVLLYHEILEGDFQAFYVRQDSEGELRSFLLGGRNNILEYTIE